MELSLSSIKFDLYKSTHFLIPIEFDMELSFLLLKIGSQPSLPLIYFFNFLWKWLRTIFLYRRLSTDLIEVISINIFSFKMSCLAIDMPMFRVQAF